MPLALARGVNMIVAAALLLGGCAKAHPTNTHPPIQPNPEPKVASDVTQRVRDLSHESEQLADLAHQLPGGTTPEHERLVREVFSEMGRILPMLRNPRDNPLLAQRLTILDNSRAQLAAGSHDLASEPTIDTGLRAAFGALRDIATTSYYERADLGPLLDTLSAKIDHLDVSRGYQHQIEVAETVDVMSQVVSKMASVLGQRVAEQNGATTQPATTSSTQ